ncbi:hypothetical protein [Rhizobium sullae]|uniref:Uncharacterized protein n=1 Tax=Rhizobium sullae TaxID=50338 RepID=A0A4R3QEH5_RHISU|nr:hypothetical protein [Rhizobium sullae]TCU20043.1 hypothetical protein EV132_101107 [Rhizobium sullae]
MNKLLSALTAVVLAASFALPLNAAPIFVPIPEQVETGSVVQVKNWHHRHWHAGRRWDRRYASCRYYGSCYPRRYSYYGRPGYYGEYPDYYRYHRRSGVSIYFDF